MFITKNNKMTNTLSYLNYWREGRVRDDYIRIQDIMTDILNNPKFSHLFCANGLTLDKKIDEFREVLDSYLSTPENQYKQHSFNGLRCFLYELTVMRNCIDNNIIRSVIGEEVKYIFNILEIYYRGSQFYEESIIRIKLYLDNN